MHWPGDQYKILFIIYLATTQEIYYQIFKASQLYKGKLYLKMF